MGRLPRCFVLVAVLFLLFSDATAQKGWRRYTYHRASVPNYGAYIIYDSVVAPPGTTYHIKASGSVQTRFAQGIYVDSCDAEYYFKGNTAVLTGPGGADSLGLRFSITPNNYTYFQPPAIANLKNGFQPDHIYNVTCLSQGYPLTFVMYDRGYPGSGWHGDDNGSYEIEVSFVDAGMAVQSDTIKFGQIPLSTTSIAFDTIQAFGLTALQVDSIRLIGPPEFTFVSEKGTGPLTLLEKSENNFEIRFLPTSIGAKEATLRIYSNAAGTQKVRDITLLGSGIIPFGFPVATYDTLDFGTILLNRTKTLQDTLRNIGATILKVEQVSNSNPTDFSIIGNQGAFDLGPSGSAEVYTITFQPTTHAPNGIHTSILRFTYDQGKTKDILLIGRDHPALDATLFISDYNYGQAGDTVIVSQRLLSDLSTTLKPQRTLTERITYSPAILTFERVDKGALLTNAAWNVVGNALTPGTIDVNINSATEAFGKPGQLLRFVFTVNKNAIAGDSSVIEQVNASFGDPDEPIVSVTDGTVHVEGACALPRVTTESGTLASYIEQNSPNPFNPTTQISYSVGAQGSGEPVDIVICLYNSLGERVRTLVEAKQLPGNYTLLLDGSSLPSGVYLCQFRAGNTIMNRQMVLAR